jgi:tetratricopeptide (TPR) repeat protein
VGWVRTQLALKSTRLGQWLASLAAGAGGGDGAPTNWAGLRMFAGHELAPDDPRRDAVERNFTANLDAIVASGVGSGARVLVSSVASNLRECGPFASRHATTMPAAEQAEWGALFQTAVSLADSGEAGAALPLLHTAVTESPAHAEAQFRLAEQELTGPDATAAVVRFGQARDADAMPFRADSRLNGAARRVATQWAARGVEWVDAVEVLARSAPDGVPGGESFHEHVHLNFDGNYRLARMFADQVAPGLPGAVTNRAAAAWATQEVCERRLGLTDWNRSAVLESMLGRVVEAPYTSQLHADDRLQRIRAELGRAREGLDPSTRAEAPSLYEDAIRRAPQDHRLHENYAEFLEATGDVPAAMAEWTRVRALIPHHLSGWYQSGRLYARLRQPAEARAALEQALRLRPDLAEALVELATVEAAEGNLDVALQRCDAALRMRPGEARIHVQRADVLARMKRRDDAVASLREAVRVQPGYWDAHYLLGVELAVDEKLKEAEAEFAEVVRLRPDHILGRVNLGVSLAKQARFDEAEVQFNEVLRLDPVNARALQAMEMIKTLRARTAAPGLGPLR